MLQLLYYPWQKRDSPCRRWLLRQAVGCIPWRAAAFIEFVDVTEVIFRPRVGGASSVKNTRKVVVDS